MRKKGNIVSYSLEELKEMVARGEDRTDWSRIDEMTGDKLEELIANDPDEITDLDWSKAIIGIPPPKDPVNIRVDRDVLQWFRGKGKGYQTMMNNVLRAYFQVQQFNDPPSTPPRSTPR